MWRTRKTAVLVTAMSIGVVSTLAGGAVVPNSLPEDPAGREMLSQAQKSILAYYTGHPRTNYVLRVVYFVPKDGKPLPNYVERLNRVMNDISDFYRDGLRRLGVMTDGLPLERKNGKLVLHLVRGKQPYSKYHYNSGGGTAQEVRDALKNTMEVEHETVLVFYALCRKETDGHYVFDSPYYGGGSQNGGLCHAADCELLDPLLLTKTNQPMVFTEHYYPHFETTVARFNTMYLGGVAHELGHAFGLPHDGGSKAEKYFGISLMGGGNVNYRQEVWGGGLPVYLGRASALQLASHPLITHSDRGRSEPPESVLNSLTFTTTNNMVTINGVIGGAVPPYAVIAYVWPVKARTDHQARTFQSVLHDGAFALDLAGLQPDSYHLRLARLHANGAAAHEMFRLDYTDGNTPDVAALNAQWKSR